MAWTKEQIEAIEKSGTNIIVSAGAGSGKTAVLSERVINKLKNGIHVDELLILTFTHAAADEMKSRIREKINEDPALIEESKRIESAYITTFDSFALSIVKKYHYLLNIKKDISIADDGIVNILKEKVLDEVFESMYASHNKEFEDFMSAYTVKSDKSIRENITNIISKLEGMITRDEYLDNLSTSFYDDNIDRIIDEYKELLHQKRQALFSSLSNLRLYFDSKYIEKIETIVLPILNIEDVDEYTTISSFRLPPVPANTSEEAKNIKTEFKSQLDEYLSFKEYGTIKNIKEKIFESKKYIDTIIRIIKDYFKRMNEIKQREGIYTFQDISELAIKIFKTNKNAREEIKSSFKEIMIDEYQDTNDIQEVFMSYISNNNVYMVGDIKQSIYRFRGSNPNIFKEKYDRYSKSDGGIKIDLLKNFRSRDEVIKDINKIFSLIMNDTLGGAEYIVSHAMIFGNDDYTVEKEDIDYDLEVMEYECPDDYSKEEVEIFTIAKDIKKKINDKIKVFDKKSKKLRDIKYSDFVIILDRSKYFDLYKKIFEYMGIPLTISRDGALNASMDMELIKNIIDFVIKINEQTLDNEFKFDFVSIARSFLYEYDDDYIAKIVADNAYKETTIYKDLSSIKDYNSLTSDELLNKVLSVTSFYEKLNKIGNIDDTNVRIEAIYNLSKNLSDMGLCIKDFKEYLGDIIEKEYEIKYKEWVMNSDTVTILTIHKSKGLEYPICYFADLDHSFNKSELKDKFICSNDYGLIIPDRDNNDNILKELYKENFKREEIGEKIRLFYVALTRAREKMIIVLPYKDIEKYGKDENGVIDINDRLKSSSLGDFIYMTKPYMPERYKMIKIEELGLTKSYLYKKDINSSLELSSDESFEVTEIHIENDDIEEKQYSKKVTSLISKEAKSNIEYGTKIHSYLEYIDFKKDDIKNIKDDKIKNHIEKFISLLGPLDNVTIYKEYEFVKVDNDTISTGSIDLMLEYSDSIKIIDYKLSNIEDEKYLKQLKGYKDYVSTITTKPIHTYLYSIVDNKLKEV